MLTQLLCCRSRFGVSAASQSGGGLVATTAVLTSKNVLRHIGASARPSSQSPARRGLATDGKASSSLSSGGHGQATILVQQGCGDIQELPVIIRKLGHTDDITVLCSALPHDVDDDAKQALLLRRSDGHDEGSVIALCDADRIIRRLDERPDADGPPGVLAFVRTLSAAERLPEVLSEALLRLLRLATVQQLDQLEATTTSDIDADTDAAVFSQLVCDVCAGCDVPALLAVMAAVPGAMGTPSNTPITSPTASTTPTAAGLSASFASSHKITAPPQMSGASPQHHQQHRAAATAGTSATLRRLVDELLLRSTLGQLSAIEICECIARFADCRQHAAADKFWSALSDLDRSIDEHNIRFVYAALQQLRVSRRMVLGVLERRIRSVFWKMPTAAVCDVMDSLLAVGPLVSSARTLQTLARWLNTNIHAVDEAQLAQLVDGFTRLDFSDEQIQRALERYAKAKGVRIVDQRLVQAMLRHCAAFRLRNAHVLNGMAEYFGQQRAELLQPGTLRELVCTFGALDYQPSTGVRFWKAFERSLECHFERLSPGEVIDVMLACVYLGMYPLNFTRRVFTPYFLDRLHTAAPLAQHPKLRADLKLFDTAMALECTEYAGPMLPRDVTAKSVWQDGRIRRMVQSMADVWPTVAGGAERFSKHVVHQQLPYHALYVIDVLVHPAGMGQLWKFNAHTDRNVYAAVLVHVPEHYDAAGAHLVGAQAMRVRHLRLLGLRVVQLEYETLARLRVHGTELREYVVERMRAALPAIG